jgi:Sulfotransferase domain
MMLKTITFFFLSVLNPLTSAEEFIIFTPPKCGTHLICNVLSYMLRKPPHITDQFKTFSEAWVLIEAGKNDNSFLISHSFTKEILENFILKGYKIIFIIRDPRDQLISMMYWMQKGYWDQFQVAFIKDKTDQIEELITGNQFGWKCYEGCIGSRLDMINQLDPAHVYITHYEILVGSEGGGDHALQLAEIHQIAKFLNLEISSEYAEEISRNIYGFGWSFREGKIGSWKKHFLPSQAKMYNALYSEILINLGYEL